LRRLNGDNSLKVSIIYCRQPAADISLSPVAIFTLQTQLRCGADDSSDNSWQPCLSGGSRAGVEQEQSASTDEGRLVAVVFSAADKGPSVSAVVQLTLYHRFLFF